VQSDSNKEFTVYYGDNGAHEFYEDVGSNILVLRNYGDTKWIATLSPAPSKRVLKSHDTADSCLRDLADAAGLTINIDPSKQWQNSQNGRGMDLKDVQP
jgi:hypothetical protein